MHKSKGFSLIEMAVVITIIGILIGALAIRSNSVTGSATSAQAITDIKDLIQAAGNFKAQYHYLPGDMPAAGQDIANTSAGCNIPTSTGNIGNGLVDNDTERLCAAEELVNAGLIKGLTDGIRVGGSTSPNARISSRRAAGNLPPTFTALNEIEITDLSCDTARAIDNRIDDGNFTTGHIRASMATCNDNDTVPFVDVSI